MSESNIIIRPASVDELIDLRWRVLRPGLPREAANFPGNNLPTTRHFAAVAGDVVVGCASFEHSVWQGQPAWQLRGMAVTAELRGQKIGSRILQFAEAVLASERYSDQLWCNARTPATKFYLQHGWALSGEEFVDPISGPHFKMTKILKVDPAPVR